METTRSDRPCTGSAPTDFATLGIATSEYYPSARPKSTRPNSTQLRRGHPPDPYGPGFRFGRNGRRRLTSASKLVAQPLSRCARKLSAYSGCRTERLDAISVSEISATFVLVNQALYPVG